MRVSLPYRSRHWPAPPDWQGLQERVRKVRQAQREARNAIAFRSVGQVAASLSR